MTTIPLLGDEATGPWCQVLSIPSARHAPSAEQDFLAILPAALATARQGRPFVAGWLCRGPGAPLELITNAVMPVPPGQPSGPSGQPSGGRGLPPGVTGLSGACGLPPGVPGPVHGVPGPVRGELGPLRGVPGPVYGVPGPVGGGLGPVRGVPGPAPDEAGPRSRGPSLLFPPGARGRPPAPGWLTAWAGLVWAACPGRQAPPLTGPTLAGHGQAPLTGMPQPWAPGAAQPTRFESALAALMPGPFGWLVVAQPSGPLAAEVSALRGELNVLRRHDEESARFGAERAHRRLAELDTFGEAGLWQVRVLAGAASTADLAVLAPVLAASADIGPHPYRITSGPLAGDLAGALAMAAEDPGSGASVPFAATAGLLAALAGLPRQEVPGLRVLDSGQFDLTSETGPGGGSDGGPGGGPGGWLSLGAVLDGQDRAAGDFALPLPALNRHVLVTGATGTGKSQTVRHLLEQLAAAGLPWLVIEPAKSEYAGMAGRLAGSPGGGQVTVVNPADPGAIPLSVSPLEPEPGYPVQAHIDMVRALFLAAFDADEPFPQIIAQALQRAYERNGWDVVTGGRLPGALAGPVVPTLAQLQRCAQAVIDEAGYGRELRADVRGFVNVRLRSLRIGSAGRFFEGGHPADLGALLRRNVVLAIEDITNDEDKAFLMGTLVIRLVEHLRLRAGNPAGAGLRHVIVLEEAHRLLRARREGRASAHAAELFAHLLAEVRAYGEGLVVAEQIPAKLIPDVIKNTAVKVVHRLPAADDRALVGATMNLDEAQSRQVVSLPPGVAAVFADGMDRPVRVQVPYGGRREQPAPGPPPPALRRRSPACGPRCTGERACTLSELRQAELLAGPPAAQDAWLRVWVEVLVLAFLANRGLPAVPGPLRARWAVLDSRLRECLLATVIDQAVGARAAAVRASYDPAHLSASAAGAALLLLGGQAQGGARPGPTWVIPQLRWLHELERVCPLDGGPPSPRDLAPPPDFDLPGLAGWPGMRAGQRLRALRRHPLSMSLPRNRLPAWIALVGADDQAGFGQDLATAGVGLPRVRHLAAAATAMEVTGWLEVVLSWPRRFVAGGSRGKPAAAEFSAAASYR